MQLLYDADQTNKCAKLTIKQTNIKQANILVNKCPHVIVFKKMKQITLLPARGFSWASFTSEQVVYLATQ